MAPQLTTAAVAAGGRRRDPREARFVVEYLVDFNATQAAIRSGYSKKTARQQGSRLLSRAHIQAALHVNSTKAVAKTGLTVERTLGELECIAHADPRQLVGADGKSLALQDFPEELARAIQSCEFVTETVTRTTTTKDGTRVEQVPVLRLSKVRFWPKVSALELIGRYQHLWADKKSDEPTVPATGRPMRVIFGGRYRPKSSAA